jgi:peptidoglycan hydrolase CwlO-like protein
MTAEQMAKTITELQTKLEELAKVCNKQESAIKQLKAKVKALENCTPSKIEG